MPQFTVANFLKDHPPGVAPNAALKIGGEAHIRPGHDILLRRAFSNCVGVDLGYMVEVRQDYGTRVLMRTGNLAAVMKTMGHPDVRIAMHYQHSELETLRAALDYGMPNNIAEMQVQREEIAAPFGSLCRIPEYAECCSLFLNCAQMQINDSAQP